MDNTKIVQDPQNEYESKLAQEDYNINVAFFIHLKQYNNTVRDELEKRLGEVFLFSKGVEWKFDSFGIEKSGSRGKDILGYFIFRTANITDLQKLFAKEFGDYENAIKITCSVAEYKKIDEKFFEVEL
jgi:hypothetical protein